MYAVHSQYGLSVSPGLGDFGGASFGKVVDHYAGGHAGEIIGSGGAVADESAVAHEPARITAARQRH